MHNTPVLQVKNPYRPIIKTHNLRHQLGKNLEWMLHKKDTGRDNPREKMHLRNVKGVSGPQWDASAHLCQGGKGDDPHANEEDLAARSPAPLVGRRDGAPGTQNNRKLNKRSLTQKLSSPSYLSKITDYERLVHKYSWRHHSHRTSPMPVSSRGEIGLRNNREEVSPARHSRLGASPEHRAGPAPTDAHWPPVPFL